MTSEGRCARARGVTSIIRNTENAIPTDKAKKFGLSLTSSLNESLRIPFTENMPPLDHAGTRCKQTSLWEGGRGVFRLAPIPEYARDWPYINIAEQHPLSPPFKL